MAASNKIVQVPMDQELLAVLDELSRALGRSRSAVIRQACGEFLRRTREEQPDAASERGYRRIPEESRVGEAQAKLLAEARPDESW